MRSVTKALASFATSAVLLLGSDFSHAENTDVITVAYTDAPHNYNPAYATNLSTFMVLTQVFETLIREGGADGFAPGLAEKWEVSGDATVYDFWIRDNAKWSDGTIIDAAYVVESFQTLRALPDAAPPFDLTDVSISIATGSDGREVVRFELPSASSRFFASLSLLTNAVLPIHKAEDLDLGSRWETLDPNKLVYSGAYVIASIDMDANLLELRPNPHFYNRNNVMNDGVQVNFLQDNDRLAVNLVRSGALDMALMRQSGIDEFLTKNMQDYIRRADVVIIDQLIFNVQKPPFDNAEIRRAIASVAHLSSDNSLIQDNRLRVTKSFLPRAILTTIGMQPHDGPEEPIDVIFDAAQATLAEHGFDSQNRLDLRLLVNASPLHERMANLMRSRLSRIHVNAEIVVQPWSEHLAALQAGDFDIARSGWRYDLPHPTDLMSTFTSNSPYNYTGFKNDTFDELIATIDAAGDQETLRQATIAAEKLLLEQAPAVPLYQQSDDVLLAQPHLVIGDRTFSNIYRFEQIYHEQ